MTEADEKVLLEAFCNSRHECKECFCNDLCMFLLLKTGVATTCADFKRRVKKVVDRELEKQFTNYEAVVGK